MKYGTGIQFSLIVFTGALLFLVESANASIVSIQAPDTASQGERITVDILVDPQAERINSIEATVVFSTDFFDYNGFSGKQSSIPVWVEEPVQKKKGEIYFSGVIPGGLDRMYDPLNTSNTAIPVTRLFFIAKQSGKATFSISQAAVLQNDGKGSPTIVSTVSKTIAVQQSENRDTVRLLDEDITAPDPFSIQIIERSVFGKTPRLALFSANDTDGGISHYQVAVGSGDFIDAKSPFALPYRLFPYQLTVRAFDYSGNMREQQTTIPTESNRIVIVSVVVFAVLLVVAGWIRYRFYTNKVSS